MGVMEPDVVIVGAGAAGIGAALELQARGLSAIILEAAARVGGRAFTDRTSLPGHWDQGCQWLHSADRNPLVAWTDRLGADVDRRPGFDDHLFWRAGRWLDADARHAEYASIDAGQALVHARAAEGFRGSVGALLAGGPAYQRYITRLMSSCEPEEASAIGHAEYADSGVNWRVRSGFGAVIAGMARGLPVRLGQPVTAIEQRGDGVRVTTPGGTLAARAAIVTASTNVLAGGAIRFTPGPAHALLDLIGQVPCGSYEKVALALDALPAEVAATTGFGADPGDGGDAPFFQVVGGAHPKIILHMAGHLARDLDAAGAAAMADFAIGRLAAVFGSGFRRQIAGVATTGWQRNPLIRGAYSYCPVGQDDARRRLIGFETGNIAFAGEAFSPDWHTTAHGAYQSGRDAAARLAGQGMAKR